MELWKNSWNGMVSVGWSCGPYIVDLWFYPDITAGIRKETCGMFLATRWSWILHNGPLSRTWKAVTCTQSQQDLQWELTSLIVYIGSDVSPKVSPLNKRFPFVNPQIWLRIERKFNWIRCRHYDDSWQGHLRSKSSLEPLPLLLNAPHVIARRNGEVACRDNINLIERKK